MFPSIRAEVTLECENVHDKITTREKDQRKLMAVGQCARRDQLFPRARVLQPSARGPRSAGYDLLHSDISKRADDCTHGMPGSEHQPHQSIHLCLASLEAMACFPYSFAKASASFPSLFAILLSAPADRSLSTRGA